jgi:aryl-alcohol dehydrogenase-like predicted oxidoreductase
MGLETGNRIQKENFGKTGHESTRIIFGAYALSQATQTQADKVLELLLSFGVNHIDTAPMYGKAEERIGPWMERYRDHFFVATKTRSRTYQGAWKNLMRSLERLHLSCVDLWQIHGLTNAAGWEKAMGPGGTMEAFLEARQKGLVRFLGVTGHGVKAPSMHLRSLDHFEFDAVMVPYNHALMQNPGYAADFSALVAQCQDKGIALQTIKSIARRPWKDRPKTYNTYFYEPLVDQETIDHAVHWALGLQNSFVVSAGDMQVLPQVLAAAVRYTARPAEALMAVDVTQFGIEPIF